MNAPAAPDEKQERCETCETPLIRDEVTIVIFVHVLTREQIDAADDLDVNLPDAIAFCSYQHVIDWLLKREGE